MTKSAKIISFVGMIGCGKTTVGRLLASENKLPFLDTDEYLARQHQTPVAELFREYGEIAFRKLEAEALSQICRQAKEKASGLILSCGGGIVLTEENRSLLRENTYCIWITRNPATVEQNPRVLHRPPIHDDPRRYEALLRARTPLYRETAHLQIDNRIARHTMHSLSRILSQKGLLPAKA